MPPFTTHVRLHRQGHSLPLPVSSVSSRTTPLTQLNPTPHSLIYPTPLFSTVPQVFGGNKRVGRVLGAPRRTPHRHPRSFSGFSLPPFLARLLPGLPLSNVPASRTSLRRFRELPSGSAMVQSCTATGPF